METITPKELSDPENLEQCECGNYTHHRYATTAGDGYACPECYASYMSEVIGVLKKFVREIADPALTNEDINNMFKIKWCEINGIDVEDFDMLDIEI
ncbi:MAG: hypothetical protein COB15_09625 [Flavobacteriales bacterium]|nr:MAG: hypothetical protein COB15_09625 [Flavobacteriales bacterium]